MSMTTALLFGVHAHQPVGNFPYGIDDAHRRCYQPFVHMMHRFPEFPFAIHISGLFEIDLNLFEIDLNLAMPSCDGPAGCFKVGGEITGGFGQAQQHVQCPEITLLDEVLGGSLAVSASHTALVRSEPCFSVSQSEAGFEKIMQAVTLHLSWPVADIKQSLAITPQIK